MKTKNDVKCTTIFLLSILLFMNMIFLVACGGGGSASGTSGGSGNNRDAAWLTEFDNLLGHNYTKTDVETILGAPIS